MINPHIGFNRNKYNFKWLVEEITRIITKIEKPEKQKYLDVIIQALDGLMVARSELVIEMAVAEH